MSSRRSRFCFGISALIIAITAFYLMLLPPHWLLTQISLTFPGAYYFVGTSDSVVALTIDDGPDPNTTPEILETLKQFNAKAAFFLVTNRIEGNDRIVVRIVEEGHEIGNHLARHDRASISLSDQEFRAEFLKADSVLSQYAEVKWFRPGSGWYDQEMISTIKQFGYKCALGSVYPFDPLIPWSWFHVKHILLNVEPGSIIVLHDGGGRGKRTAETLRNILPILIERGFRMVTLSELVDGNSRE